VQPSNAMLWRSVKDPHANPEGEHQPSSCQGFEVDGAPLLHHGGEGQHDQRSEQRPTPGTCFLRQALNLPTAGHQDDPWDRVDVGRCACHREFGGRQTRDDLWAEGKVLIHVEGFPLPAAEVPVRGLQVVGLVPEHRAGPRWVDVGGDHNHGRDPRPSKVTWGPLSRVQKAGEEHDGKAKRHHDGRPHRQAQFTDEGDHAPKTQQHGKQP